MKSNLKLDIAIISLIFAPILLVPVWRSMTLPEERPVDFNLADGLCKRYGFQEAVVIVADGKKIKLACK